MTESASSNFSSWIPNAPAWASDSSADTYIFLICVVGFIISLATIYMRIKWTKARQPRTKIGQNCFNELEDLYIEGRKLAPEMVQYYNQSGDDNTGVWSQIEIGENWTNRALSVLRSNFPANEVFKFEHATSEIPSGKIQAQVLILKETLEQLMEREGACPKCQN